MSHDLEMCSCCGRFVKPTDRHLPDGRSLCSVCLPSVVARPEHARWVGQRVRAILVSEGVADIPPTPLRVVTPQEMSKLNNTGRLNLNQPGLMSVRRTMSFFSVKNSYHIYLFDNMPKIKFAGVLAHEMLHVWQTEKGVSLEPMYCEGFCNLGSYVVYKAIGSELSDHFIKQLHNDPDSIYGDGFRAVYAVYEREHNLQRVMDVISKY